jgi:predicted nucleic acid-binding protein
VARYVLDASAVLAYLLNEGLDAVDDFFNSSPVEDDWLAPLILLPECTGVIHEQVGKGKIGAGDAQDYLGDLLDLDIDLSDLPIQFERAIELAQQFGHAKAYDMQYLAAAIGENATLVTVDRGMRQAAINIKHPVRFLR